MSPRTIPPFPRHISTTGNPRPPSFLTRKASSSPLGSPCLATRHQAQHGLAQAEFGDASYLMALDLRRWSVKPRSTLVPSNSYPAVTKMGNAPDLRRMSPVALEGGHMAYESGDGVVVRMRAGASTPLSARAASLVSRAPKTQHRMLSAVPPITPTQRLVLLVLLHRRLARRSR